MTDSNRQRFAGQTVVISGASSGLGRQLALSFAREGAWVAVGFHRQGDAAAATLSEIQRAGGSGALWSCDVADYGQVDTAVAALLRERGSIDVLINNAAIVHDAPFALMEPDSFASVLSVNLTGAFHLCRAVVRPMLARKQGAIVNIGSVAGLWASPGQANYAAAKGGLVALTRTLAAELAPRGVRVNAVLPGLLDTGMAERLDHRVRDRRKSQIPLGRVGTAEEVARVVLFVASAEASYLVGQALVVDGGLSL